ncbi:MAG: acyltransferase [Lachnospiraceae bacterium]|nr:acyltransferase [Lachnospiraceae bacterium]
MSDGSGRRYGAMDGLRTIGTIGILMMHVRGNSDFEIAGYWYDTVVASCTNFVFLFMMLSAFSMCCGYFEKISEGDIRPEAFYKRRFEKIWPFFAMLVFLDLAISPSKESLYESIADLTLCFGLLPNAKITVIGVGWFLGVVFLFYMLFPFFVFLIESKKRAWISFLAALIVHYLCCIYFFDIEHVGPAFNGRTNIVYCAVYFLAGGLIYRYRERLERYAERYGMLLVLLLVMCMGAYFATSASVVTMLPMFSLMLIYSLSEKRRVLNNPITRFIADISMEIYLCHMVIYRVLEKMKLSYIIQKDTVAYFIAVLLVLAGSTMFAICAKKILESALIYQKILLGQTKKEGKDG